MDYLAYLVVLVSIYGILAKSLDLLVGQAGIFSLAHAAFFGMGSYATALMSTSLTSSFLVNIVAGLLLTGSVAFLLGRIALHLDGDYFLIASMGFQVAIHSVFLNWMEITRGPFGISSIPAASVLGAKFDTPNKFVFLALTCLALVTIVVDKIAESPFGRILRGIRGDELFTKSLGKATGEAKLAVFIVSCMLASTAGSLYAFFIRFIDPSSFISDESVAVMSMVIIGGAGSRWGPVLGTIILILLPEALRFVGFPADIAANLRQIGYGVAIAVLMFSRTQGIMGKWKI